MPDTTTPDPFRFQWQVARGGYRILPGSDPDAAGRPRRASEILLNPVERIEPTTPGDYTSIFPLVTDPWLARTFAAVPDDHEAILLFCKSYGLLFDGPSLALSEFKAARTAVKRILAAVDGAREFERDILSRAAGRVDFKVVRRFSSNRSAFSHVAQMFNDRVAAGFVLRLDPAFGHRRMFNFEPRSLLSAIWLLVAKEIAGGAAPWATCANPGCARNFTVGPGTGRRLDALYCSSECQREVAVKARQARLVAARAPALQARNCAACGESFLPKQARTQFCRRAACEKARHRANRRAREAQVPDRLKTRLPKPKAVKPKRRRAAK